LIGFGFAIARFGLFLQEFQSANESNASAANSQLLGLGLVVSGVAVIVLAGWRYNQVFHQIERGAYRPSRWTIWVLTVLVTFLGLLSIPLLQGQRSPSNASKSSIRRSMP
jgi:putative membrane protein